jgi:hypothetical protein
MCTGTGVCTNSLCGWQCGITVINSTIPDIPDIGASEQNITTCATDGDCKINEQYCRHSGNEKICVPYSLLNQYCSATDLCKRGLVCDNNDGGLCRQPCDVG